ncbi:FtsK/SpoIIIE domain-containing protein [Janibacter cremeus]|uniref:S-DNA-T family DNA segregation ATPase FtsK/SpoIIIE n=1 Tax=Janibacter cremeus TaxID=1285192 RepID=A0A852VZL0_9MICO|nr:FtsK/SpoIIIE domain-containing protein [Janibacter cremeus]NYF99155.1 S-DNA-T family DNA segregation ATPase FtsK/SpoIIIE [Janibacter cremeus]
MLLQMTVIDVRRGAQRLVEVRATAHDTAVDLLEALGFGSDTSMHVDDKEVPPEAPVGLPPLLDGSILVLGHDHGSVTRSTVPAPLRLTTTSGPDSGRTLSLTPGRHVVGRGEMASLRLDDDTLSREHLAVSVDRDGVLVHELDATNITLADGERLPSQGLRARVGSCVHAGNTTFMLEAHRSRPCRRRPSGSGTIMVNPTPHLASTHVTPRITIPQEPSAPARRRIPWVMVLLPLPFAALLAFFFGPRMLLFGLLTPVLAIGSTLSDRSSARRDHREARAEWVNKRTRTGEQLTSALALERRERLRSAPDATALLDAARGDSSRLWERRSGHPQHLDLRLGMAPLPARLEVERGHGDRDHPVLDHVPLVVDLEEAGVLGIAGGRDERDRLARHLLGQLTVLHSHHDVQISVVATHEGWWSPFRSLVHLREHDDAPGSGRATADEDDALALFAGHAAAIRERDRQPSGARAEDTRPTALVLVIDDVDRWRGDPNLRTALVQGRPNRVLVVVLSDTAEGLPHECGAIVQLDGDRVALHVAGRQSARGVIDGVGPAWAHRVASGLAPLRDATPDDSGAGLPEATRLVDLLDLDPDDPDAIRAAWSGRPTGPTDLDVVVGLATDGEFRIDLRRDGPHALIAGTTGSGKSEFLQSWVASLAARSSPDEITFVLVDYKGGAAFAECARLPHTVGVLTDLEPAQAERALTSLDAELTRREHILATSGAKDIDDHRGAPLPRLMIVIDEFRMLAEEQPEALAHLMKIAAVGRSLGVHLVLATQRPGGIVSADIKANVNLRIALRVRDRVDSEDVLGVPDAVDLPETAPGRALARTGGSPARSFQTGRVAGHEAPGSDGVLVRDPGSPWPTAPQCADLGPTDLQRIAATLTRVAADLQTAQPHRPWLPPLACVITAEELPTPGEHDLGAPFALVDRPERQEQVPLTWTPSSGHWMVVGGPGTGRTTSIAAIVTAAGRRWSPDRLQVQVIGDGSSVLTDLTRLPHVGSVVDGEDRPLTRRFLARLESDVARRRARLRASGHSTLDAWWAAYEADPVGDAPDPHLLLAVDGWGRVTQPLGGADLGETAELLETLLRDGVAAGVCGVVTGGRELLSGRISSLITTRLVLHLPDRGDASLAGLKSSESSGRRIPGRGRTQPGGHLVQVAQPSGESSAGAGHAVSGHERSRAWRVEPLPEEVAAARLPEPTTERMPLGLGGSGVEPVVWRVPGARRMLVCGPPGSGRTTTLVTIARQAMAAGHPVALLGGSDLTHHPDLADATVCDPQDRDGLIALRRAHPDLAVVIDDAERVEDEPVADVVKEILRRADGDRGLVVASTATQTAATRVRGLVAEIARTRAGVLLQPTSRSDGDALGLRVPPLPRLPGRGYLITQGRAEEIQVASGTVPAGEG